MSMIKHGEVTSDSQSDFDSTKKAKFLDELGTGIADESHRHMLIKPKLIEEPETKKLTTE